MITIPSIEAPMITSSAEQVCRGLRRRGSDKDEVQCGDFVSVIRKDTGRARPKLSAFLI